MEVPHHHLKLSVHNRKYPQSRHATIGNIRNHAMQPLEVPHYHLKLLVHHRKYPQSRHASIGSPSPPPQFAGSTTDLPAPQPEMFSQQASNCLRAAQNNLAQYTHQPPVPSYGDEALRRQSAARSRIISFLFLRQSRYGCRPHTTNLDTQKDPVKKFQAHGFSAVREGGGGGAIRTSF